MTAADTLAELAAIRAVEPRTPLLKALARLYTETSARAVATRMATDIARYATSAWRVESQAPATPYAAGSRRDLMWRVLRSNGKPPSFRTCYRAIGARG